MKIFDLACFKLKSTFLSDLIFYDVISYDVISEMLFFIDLKPYLDTIKSLINTSLFS